MYPHELSARIEELRQQVEKEYNEQLTYLHDKYMYSPKTVWDQVTEMVKAKYYEKLEWLDEQEHEYMVNWVPAPVADVAIVVYEGEITPDPITIDIESQEVAEGRDPEIDADTLKIVSSYSRDELKGLINQLGIKADRRSKKAMLKAFTNYLQSLA